MPGTGGQFDQHDGESVTARRVVEHRQRPLQPGEAFDQDSCTFVVERARRCHDTGENPHDEAVDDLAECAGIGGADVAVAQRLGQRRQRVEEAAKILGLTEFLERKPKALSGGQRQRVAMGRAIVRSPQVFCMDEPLSNLDAKMRVQTRTDIAKLQSDLGVTTVYVTHDQVEAMTMGDRVGVMKDGYLMQVVSPLTLYNRPNNLFVAGFIGSPQMNLMAAVADHGKASIGGYAVPVDPAASKKMQGNITVGVRPEDWRLVEADEGGFPIKVTVVEELGADSYVYGTSDVEGVPSTLIVRTDAQHHVTKGATIHVTTDPARVHVFDTDSGDRLSD